MKSLFVLIISSFLLSSLSAQTLKDCSSCATKLIQVEQIKDLSIDELRFLANDLFARRGYKFSDSNIDSYYSEKSWYKTVANNNKIIFNTVEKQNIKILQDKTTELKAERDKLINELKGFKAALQSNNKSDLQRKYNFETNDIENRKDIAYLEKTLEQVNLDDINWSKHKGIYEVTVDNGDYVMNYEISIDREKVNIKYANQGGSEYSELVYPNYMITKYTYLWKFEWKNGRLRFVDFIVAG